MKKIPIKDTALKTIIFLAAIAYTAAACEICSTGIFISLCKLCGLVILPSLIFCFVTDLLVSKVCERVGYCPWYLLAGALVGATVGLCRFIVQ